MSFFCSHQTSAKELSKGAIFKGETKKVFLWSSSVKFYNSVYDSPYTYVVQAGINFKFTLSEEFESLRVCHTHALPDWNTILVGASGNLVWFS